MLRDKRRAEERLAATKHQQPQTNNGQQQGHKQAGELQENYVEFLPTTDKNNERSKNTESSQHSMFEDRQAQVGMSETVLTCQANASLFLFPMKLCLA